MLTPIPVPALSDNYIWILRHPDEPAAIVVDPGEAAPILSALEEGRLEPAAILITHHHGDHVAGLADLRGRHPDIPVYGPADEAVAPDATVAGTDAANGVDDDDPWGAEAFLEDLQGTAYGTTPGKLRDGLEVVCEPDRGTVWFTPGLPFVVPMFVGLVVALTYGDVLFVLLRALGLLG